jgi:hypothetical protein
MRRVGKCLEMADAAVLLTTAASIFFGAPAALALLIAVRDFRRRGRAVIVKDRSFTSVVVPFRAVGASGRVDRSFTSVVVPFRAVGASGRVPLALVAARAAAQAEQSET